MKKRMSKPIACTTCHLPTATRQLAVILTPRVTRPELFGACQLTRRGRHDVVA